MYDLRALIVRLAMRRTTNVRLTRVDATPRPQAGEGRGEGRANAERTVTIKDIRHSTETLTTYSLEVANAHTFFVGEEGVLVHNGRSGGGGGGMGCNNDPDPPDDCKAIKKMCIAKCSTTPPLGGDRMNQGMPFFNCVNDCLDDFGCL